MSSGLIETLTNEKQDPKIVQQVCAKVQDILTRGETIMYVAVQKKPVVNIAPDSVVLTNRRFIHYRPSLVGRVTFDDHSWRELQDARLQEQVLGAQITMTTVHGRAIEISYLPKAQARRLYAFAQEMEEKVREERRRRDLEDKRAAAGGVVVGTGADLGGEVQSAQEPDPVERLKKLKEMLDAELITQGEFDSKRAEIIAKM